MWREFVDITLYNLAIEMGRNAGWVMMVVSIIMILLFIMILRHED
jgi:uncharacterized integral membrane protein